MSMLYAYGSDENIPLRDLVKDVVCLENWSTDL